GVRQPGRHRARARRRGAPHLRLDARARRPGQGQGPPGLVHPVLAAAPRAHARRGGRAGPRPGDRRVLPRRGRRDPARLGLLAEPPAPPIDERPLSARPYVITSVPDDGPATTVLTMNELDGCMEGVNEHGLAVALNLADAENAGTPVDAGPQVGVSSGQLPRFLLDTCRTAEEAKAALLSAKQYDLGVGLHYLVADPSGAAFVWERGLGGDEHVVEADGGALCMTNHPLHRHPDPAALPEDTGETLLTYQRYRTLVERSAGTGLSAERMREALDAVRVDASTDTPYPIRTLWRTVVDLERRAMATRFYLGDAPDGAPRYSPEREFAVPAPHPA